MNSVTGPGHYPTTTRYYRKRFAFLPVALSNSTYTWLRSYYEELEESLHWDGVDIYTLRRLTPLEYADARLSA